MSAPREISTATHRCPDCGRFVGLRRLAFGRPVPVWRCRGCGALLEWRRWSPLRGLALGLAFLLVVVLALGAIAALAIGALVRIVLAVLVALALAALFQAALARVGRVEEGRGSRPERE